MGRKGVQAIEKQKIIEFPSKRNSRLSIVKFSIYNLIGLQPSLSSEARDVFSYHQVGTLGVFVPIDGGRDNWGFSNLEKDQTNIRQLESRYTNSVEKEQKRVRIYLTKQMVYSRKENLAGKNNISIKQRKLDGTKVLLHGKRFDTRLMDFRQLPGETQISDACLANQL